MRAMGKRRKCPSLLIFHRIKKGQKRRSPLNWKIRSPPFLWFFYPSKIERPTAFSLRLVVHALCFDQLYCCTCKLFSSLCTLVQDNLAPAWPQYDVNTCWNLIGQKEASQREASQDWVPMKEKGERKIGFLCIMIGFLWWKMGFLCRDGKSGLLRWGTPT